MNGLPTKPGGLTEQGLGSFFLYIFSLALPTCLSSLPHVSFPLSPHVALSISCAVSLVGSHFRAFRCETNWKTWNLLLILTFECIQRCVQGNAKSVSSLGRCRFINVQSFIYFLNQWNLASLGHIHRCIVCRTVYDSDCRNLSHSLDVRMFSLMRDKRTSTQ